MRFFCNFNLFVVVSILLSGCIVQSSQLNGLLGLIREPPIDLSKNSWSVRYSGYESVVFAVSTSDGILFSNNAGDEILFDGWTITKVRGIGLRRLNVTIHDSGNTRTFKRGNRIVSNHICDHWEKQRNFEVVRHLQYCSGKQSYENSILVQNNGDVSVIRQIVDERYTALTLSKLK